MHIPPPPTNRVLELLKKVAYRSRPLAFLSAPSYRYNLEPAELAFLVGALTETHGMTGAVVEAGVARGMTTTFLCRHLDGLGDARPYLCLDTFAGFTEADAEFEATHRGKSRSDLSVFAYNDVEVFRRNMRRAGITRVEARPCDIGTLTAADIGPVSVALLDVDLYQPTARALPVLYECLQPGGVIMVDDIIEDNLYDGAAQAFLEFIGARNIEPVLIADKGGVIRKPL